MSLLAVEIGFKAERLGRALHAGLPALPGWVLPVSVGREALRAGADAVRVQGVAAGRGAVLSRPVDSALDRELRAVVDGLGGRVIVRSSSPLEQDPVWAGAFSSVTGVGRDDVAGAVRSCWASAFAVDPLRRLDACGLPLTALELAVLLQPEITPEAGGLARLEPDSVAGLEVTVAGVRGHPGPLLSGWAEGAHARVRLPAPGAGADHAGPERGETGGLAALIGAGTVADVAGLAGLVHAELGDDVIEWAACDSKVWLLQSLRGTRQSVRSGPVPGQPVPSGLAPGQPVPSGLAPGQPLPSGPAAGPPQALAALIQARGTPVPARPAAPGTAAGPLLACRPHETAARDCRDAILLVDRPLPALAPLLFGARGVISRSGAAGSHLAEVARSLGVPMVTGCHPEPVTGADPAPGAWVAVIDGGTGDVVLSPARVRR